MGIRTTKAYLDNQIAAPLIENVASYGEKWLFVTNIDYMGGLR